MKTKTIILSLIAACAAFEMSAVDLKSDGRDPEYVNSIIGRTRKIVDNLNLDNDSVATQVTNIIANRYFKLNDIYETRDAKIKFAKDSLEGEAKKAEINLAGKEADAALYRCHFEFPADLSLFLTPEQIEAVKDGMTYGVVKVTYDSYVDMIPSLTDEEKHQILAWLIEARELAVDAENSKKKHETFGKYKGRINNYLTARGYDMNAEREAWYERVKARGGQL